MNERFELETLKKRQHYLEVQLAALRQDMQRLQDRLSSQPEIKVGPAPVEPEPVHIPPQMRSPARVPDWRGDALAGVSLASAAPPTLPPPIPQPNPAMPKSVAAPVETSVEMPAPGSTPVGA